MLTGSPSANGSNRLRKHSSAQVPLHQRRTALAFAGRTAEALRGLVFALEASRLLRDAAVTPTAEQLIEADAATRERRADVDAALNELESLIKSTSLDGTGSSAGPGRP